MNERKVSFWIEEGFALYSSKPLVEKYSKKNYSIWIYTQKNIEKLVVEYFSEIKIEIILIDQKRNYLLDIMTRLFSMFFIDRKFSVMYDNDLTKYHSVVYNFINKICPFKVKKENINTVYFNTMKLFNRFRFQGDFVIAFTFVNRPYLFANNITKIILVMESWDHNVKRPHLIKPNFFMTWNRDLGFDAKEYQNYKHIGYIRPMKLRYTEKFNTISNDIILKYISNEDYLKDLQNILNNKIILYPTTLTSIDHYERYLNELKLIKSISNMLSGTDFVLFVKPKPTGPLGDYDSLEKEANIIIGKYSPSVDKADMLKIEYHAYRFLLLRNSKLVINVGTTFGLDAAMASVPIMQLNILEENFGLFAKYSKNPHLKKYLLSSSYVILYTGAEIISINEEFMHNCKKYSENLRNWCLNGAGRNGNALQDM